jgi:hypothetical protein
MKNDIAICKDLVANGISVGVQKITGEIDIERLKMIVEWAILWALPATVLLIQHPILLKRWKILQVQAVKGC